MFYKVEKLDSQAPRAKSHFLVSFRVLCKSVDPNSHHVKVSIGTIKFKGHRKVPFEFDGAVAVAMQTKPI